MTGTNLDGGSTQQSTPSLKPRGVLETALYVSDVHAARAWYERVLGLEATTFEPPRHVFFPLGSSMLLVFNPDETRKVVLKAKKHPRIQFESRSVKGDGSAYQVEGDLTLVGTKRRIRFPVRKEGDSWVGEADVHQPDFGIKPYQVSR